MQNIVVLTDFDGTLAAEDVGHRLLVEFAEPGWQEILTDYKEGQFGSAEFYDKVYGAMTASEDELYSFVASKKVAEGFQEFYDYLQGREIPIYIVSDGFDFYIKPILKHHNLSEIKYYSNHLEYDNDKERFTVDFPGSHPTCNLCGNCKASIVQEYLQQGKRVVYIGDGISDFYAASIADFVFAKGRLAEYCEENGLDYIPFQDYNDVLGYLKEHPELEYNFDEINMRKCMMKKKY